MICPKISTPGGNCPKIRTLCGNCRRNCEDNKGTACIINAFQRWEAVMVAVDFSTQQSATGYKMLLETGPSGQTGLPRLQAASIWVSSLLPHSWQEHLQGSSSPETGSTYGDKIL